MTKKKLPNTMIYYLYRDGGNWKQTNQVILKGTLTEKQIGDIIDKLDGDLFIPRQVGLPEDRFDDSPTPDDHCYFELDEDGFEPTDLEPSEEMTMQELYDNFMAVEFWDDVKYAYGPYCENEDEDDEDEE